MGSATPTPPTRSGVRDARARPCLPVVHLTAAACTLTAFGAGKGSGGDVPEGNMNGEIANHLREHGHHADRGTGSHFRLELVEILEAILLAVVALAAALSGYQVAKWDGVNASSFATSSRLRVQSEQASLTSNQTLMYDSGNLTAWLRPRPRGTSSWRTSCRATSSPTTHRPSRPRLQRVPLTNPKAPVGRVTCRSTATRWRLRLRPSAPRRRGPTPPGRGARDRRQVRAARHHPGGRAVPRGSPGSASRIKGVRITVISVAGALLLYCAILLAIYPRA